MMLTALFLRSPTNLRAYGADDELSQHVLDPVLSLGHSNSPLLAHFCQAPKHKELTTAYERPSGWIIHLDKIVSKSHFLRYAARYVRRPPIAKWRLLKVTDRESSSWQKTPGESFLSERVVI